jgi:hypothetical protein
MFVFHQEFFQFYVTGSLLVCISQKDRLFLQPALVEVDQIVNDMPAVLYLQCSEGLQRLANYSMALPMAVQQEV